VDFESWDTGLVRGFHNVFGLGNVLTGKGNIKESRKNAGEIAEQVVSAYLGVGKASEELDAGHAAARAAAEPAVNATQQKPKLSPAQIEHIFGDVKKHWDRTGYAGDYAAWIDKVTPRGEEV